MIASALVRAWTCPHCGGGETDPSTVSTVITRCTHCRFVFPALLEELDETPIPEAAGVEDTWSPSWGPIRADRYQVLRVLTSGSQGKILLAHHRHLQQRCVIKLVATDDDLWTDVANQRLRNEAQAGIRVNHVNVARVYDCDCVDESWYFVMEYVAGENLRRLLQTAGFLPPEQVADIGVQVAAGLAAIHRQQLIHRDLKPSNLMLTHEGVLKIMDLGLVKAGRAGGTGITHAGQVLGTPVYMPPEQFHAGHTVDARADLYALGATLFHLAVGHAPFEGSNVEELARRHRHDPIVWTHDDSRPVPAWLRDIIDTCLAKRPEHRFATADDLERALRDRAAAPRHVSISSEPASRGIAVLPFRNLSRLAEDEWIGDALAEYLCSRLATCAGVHVIDRGSLNQIVRRTAESSANEPSPEQILAAGRLFGVGHLLIGSFQRSGDQLRVVAQAHGRETPGAKTLASVCGRRDALFELEDQLAAQVLPIMAPSPGQGEGRGATGGGTTNLAAHEHYIRAARAFADGDYPMAMELARQAESLDPEYTEPISLLGAAHARLGHYDQAIRYHERQECLARERDDSAEWAVALGNLGAVHYYKGEYPVAYEFLSRAAHFGAQRDPTPDAAKLYANLGMVLMRLDKSPEAEQAFSQAIDLCKRFRDFAAMVWPYNGMGSLLLKQRRFAESREYHQRALSLAEETGDRVMVGVSQMNIGRCACLTEDFTEAAIWFNAALGSLERTNFWNGLTLVHEHMAEMYLCDHMVDEALGCIDKRLELAQRHGNQRMESQAWEQKARAFEQSNRTAEALAALRKSVEVSQRPEPYESLHRYLAEATRPKPYG